MSFKAQSRKLLFDSLLHSSPYPVMQGLMQGSIQWFQCLVLQQLGGPSEEVFCSIHHSTTTKFKLRPAWARRNAKKLHRAIKVFSEGNFSKYSDPVAAVRFAHTRSEDLRIVSIAAGGTFHQCLRPQSVTRPADCENVWMRWSNPRASVWITSLHS